MFQNVSDTSGLYLGASFQKLSADLKRGSLDLGSQARIKILNWSTKRCDQITNEGVRSLAQSLKALESKFASAGPLLLLTLDWICWVVRWVCSKLKDLTVYFLSNNIDNKSKKTWLSEKSPKVTNTSLHDLSNYLKKSDNHNCCFLYISRINMKMMNLQQIPRCPKITDDGFKSQPSKDLQSLIIDFRE